MAMLSPSLDAEEFWDDLLAFVEQRQVIPIVGSEVLQVEQEGKLLPLYLVVASRLLQRYGLTGVRAEENPGPVAQGSVLLRPHRELNDAVCALARAGRRLQDLYRPVHDTLRSVLGEQTDPIPPALTQLAAIRNFDLFVSTTCDDLLLRAVNRVRGDGAADSIEYAPNLSSDKVRDIPELRSSGYSAVFHAFGRATASPQFAIHEEDILEFVYGLQTGLGSVPERMIGAIRSRNLLFIGCNFSDWLGRFMLRVANQTRLSGDRGKKEFLVDTISVTDESLTLFLERFSQNTRIYPGNAAEFVAELNTRWTPRQPVAEQAGPSAAPLAAQPARRGEIFISYSSADRPAARKLAEAIQAVGGEVVWFDRHDLHAGDDWKAEILEAIRRCSLFVAIISASTEQRNEGFFRLEWDEACQRVRMIQGRTFILPIVVDDQYDPTRYSLIPEAFQKYQFSHAPGGAPSADLATVLVGEIRALRR